MSRTRVALLLVGDELTSGRRRDGNGAWMAARVTALGGAVVELRLVGDEVEALAATMRDVARGADLVVVSGGLGPTSDDRTRDGLAKALGEPLEEDPVLWDELVARLASRGRTPRPLHHHQAKRPPSAAVVPNPVGTAVGLEVRLEGATLICLPGVPAELQAMFEATIAPRLAAASEVARGVLWVMGRPEALVAEQLEALPEAAAVRLAWYAHHGEIEVRVEADREQDSEAFLAAARDLLGEDRYEPAEGERLQHVVVRALAARGWKVATAESITGGLVAERLTSVPGASTVLDVSWVTYAPAAKTRELGVPADLIEREGVVSQAVAEAMAAGALERARADVAVATTGVAGPDTLPGPDGLPVPVGRVHVALAARDGRRAHRRLDLPLVRDLVRHHAALAALDLLRRAARVG
ncbi:MAG: nicotinamide-nucleotide amidohydrolase family protein [Planctomycetes bacterium]|nr:nicotinamide-nucleotide amidohydrolase family protein [Planctomycetota bacterium]MCB9824905.1 nicotinamide-nucleotide amidohydrolase family protein [Planctomycetota bacterium]MCB9830308.1 nicotinamide-nucleotide amidohydrolase family protein [Planctomycetota bacterium]MCB9902174.1 nicotinamide-nucleotide amidohydrolase family protein [Planctomycetota bacterium]